MPFESAARARPTIVEAGDRFAKKSAGGPFDVDDELAAAFRSLRQSVAEVDLYESRRETPAQSGPPNFLDALEMIASAAELLTSMESHAQKVQAQAYEITQRAQYDVRAAEDEAASLRQKLSEKDAEISRLNGKIAEAEERTRTAQQWLRRFQDAVTKAFPAQKLGDFRLLLDGVRAAE